MSNFFFFLVFIIIFDYFSVPPHIWRSYEVRWTFYIAKGIRRYRAPQRYDRRTQTKPFEAQKRTGSFRRHVYRSVRFREKRSNPRYTFHGGFLQKTWTRLVIYDGDELLSTPVLGIIMPIFVILTLTLGIPTALGILTLFLSILTPTFGILTPTITILMPTLGILTPF